MCWGGGGVLTFVRRARQAERRSLAAWPTRSSPEDLGFGVWSLGGEFGVWGVGFGVWGLGFGVWGFEFRVWGIGLRI